MIQKIYLFIFFIIAGEFVARVSNNFLKEYKNPNQDYGSVIQGSYNNDILLLGDSYTAGHGIILEERISSSLINMKTHNVLDYSRGSDNWIHYLEKISNYESKLKEGDFIIIGVNWNDILFNQNLLADFFNNSDNKSEINNVKEKVNYRANKFAVKRFISSIYRHSELIEFLSANIQNTLKRRGVLIPFGDFYYLSNIGYKNKSTDLIQIIRYVEKISLDNKVNVIIYLFPDFNVLNRGEYFEQFTSFFEKSFSNQSIQVVNGVKQFSNSEDGYYCLSTRDGHPNGLAHLKISDTLKQIIYRPSQ